MHNISDDTLLKELKRRFKENKSLVKELREMTEQLREVNSRLKESEAMKSGFISNIRNEINNPLSSIMELALQVADIADSEPETSKAIATSIHREAFDLGFILMNIFMAAEIEAGDAALNASRVHVSSLLKNVLAELKHKIGEKRIALELSNTLGGNDGNSPVFNTDGEKLQLVMLNLLSNAVKYSPEGGTIEVDLHRDGEALEFLVRDYGIGIEKSAQKKIFERFKQLDSGSTKSYRGQGLGLSITKALVEILVGTLRVESSTGKGSAFVVRISEAGVGVESEVLAMHGNVFIFNEEEMDEEF
jgi:signal transduction histidine kinase